MFQKQKTMSDNNAAMWNAAGQIGSSAINATAASSMNRRTRKWNEAMYSWQRQDALDDWERNNQYNHPSSQMARLREAGLNPNLVYGKGADVTSAPIRSTEMKAWNPQTPQWGDIARAPANYMAAQMQSAQIDNLRAQNTVIQEQALLMQAQRQHLGFKNDMTSSQTNINKLIAELKSANMITDVAYRKQQLSKLVADTDYTVNQDARAQRSTNQSILESVERTLNLQYQRKNILPAQMDEIRNRIKTGELQQQLMNLEKELNEMGIQKTDPFYVRVAARAAQTIKRDVQPTKPSNATEQRTKYGQNWFKKNFPIIFNR